MAKLNGVNNGKAAEFLAATAQWAPTNLEASLNMEEGDTEGQRLD